MIKRLLFSVFATLLCQLAIAQSISSNSPLCTDNSPTLELKASGGSTYAWSGPSNFASNQQNPTISRANSSNSGTYTCIIDGKTVLTTLVKIGKFVSALEAYYYISGARIVMYSYIPNNSNSNLLSYSWTGANNYKATGSSAYINGFDKTSQGNYTVIGTDEFGCSATKTIQVNVSDCSYQPRIFARSKSGNTTSWSGSGTYSLTVCDSSPTVLEADTAYWGTGLKFQWFKDGKAVPNATALQLSINDEGKYYVQIIKGSCSYQTPQLNVKTGNLTPFIELDNLKGKTLLEKEICNKGGSTILTSYISTDNYLIDGQVSRQWYKDGLALVTQSSNSSQFTATEAGKYQVKVKAGQCETISEPITVKAVEQIKPYFYFNVSGDEQPTQKTLKVCNEYSSWIDLNGKLLGSGSKKLYKNGALLTQITANQLYYSVSQQPGTYVLETTQGQCKSLDTLTLEYGKTTDIFITRGDSYSCTNPANFYYYINPNTTPYNGIKWYKSDALFSSFGSLNPNSSAIYQAKYENSSSGCKGESAKINVTIPSTPSNVFLKITFPYTKKMTVCKNNKDLKMVRLNTYFETGGVWKRDGKIHDPGSSYYQTSVSQAGKYWYEFNNGQCTVYSDTLEVIEEELPKVTLTQTCLKDNSVKLNINSTSGVKYNWFQNGVVLGAKDTTLIVSQSGTYVAETYRNGCFASSNEVNVGASVAESFSICNGDSLKLKSVGDASTIFNWTGPNNFKSNLQNPVVAKSNKNNQGFYKLSVTDKGGCVFVTQTRAVVNDYPAFALPKTITACAGSDFIFNQFVSKPLTDSTESVGYFYTTAPNKNNYYGNFYLNNLSSRDAGVYNVLVYGNQGGCAVKTSTELIVDATSACRSIALGTLPKNFVCTEQTADIPFTTNGNFKSGTVFRAYSVENYYSEDGLKIRKTILGTSQKSPIKISGLKSSTSYNIFVESEDGVASISSQYLYTNSPNNNYISDAGGYNRSAECTSLPLIVGSSSNYLNSQWFLNGDTLKKETNRNITALKTGTYTFKGIDVNGCNVTISKAVVIGKLDKPLISSYINDLSCFNESSYVSTVQSYNNVKYTWRRDGVLQSDNNNYIQATIAGKYTLEVSKETCKVNSDTIVIKQNSDKSTNLTTYTYTNRDNNNELQTYIYINGLGSAIYKYQLFKDNQLFAEGKDAGVLIKDPGKYFFKVVKGDCEAISDVIDYKGVNSTISNQRNLYYNGTYDYTSNIVQLCDTNSVQTLYGYPAEYPQGIVVKRVITAYQNDKPLPVFKDGVNVYPSLRYNPIDSYFYVYFRGAGSYYVTEEVTLKDSTKLRFKYGDLKVSISPVVNVGIKTPQNIFSCSDSIYVYGNSYSANNQRPISFTWKKDGVSIRKITNPNDANYLIVKQSGTYVLETTYKGGCIGISTPNKVEIGKVGIGIDTTSRVLCDGITVTLNSSSFQGFVNDTNKLVSQVSYQWVKDGKDYTQLKNILPQDIYRTISLPTKDAGVYALKVQQGKCQGISPNVIIKIDKVPNSLNYADSVLFCQTQSVNLKTNEDAALTYIWERDGGFVKDANKATLEIKEAGIYRSLNRKGVCWNYTPKVRAKVLANILPTAALTGDKNINYSDTAKVSIAFTSHAPWTFKLSDGKEYTATKSPFEVSLRPQFSTNYTLTEVKNVCGTGTISGSANIKVLVLSSELEEGVNLNVFPIPSKEDVNIQLVLEKPEAMEWTLNSVSGNVLFSESQPNKSSKHESSVSLKSLPEGTYYLRIQAGEKSLVRKIIKTN